MRGEQLRIVKQFTVCDLACAYHIVGMGRVTIRVLGCGDAFGSGGRLQTCFFVSSPKGGFLIDCGATALVGMHRFGVDPGAVETIVLSHLHGDHFGGLPFVLLHAHFAGERTRPLTIAGPPGTQARVETALDVLFPGSASIKWRFPLEFVEISPGRPREIGGVSVRAYEVVHSSEAGSLGLRLRCEGKTIAYSGDTRWTESLVSLADGADLFIVECYAFDQDIPAHLNYRTLLAHRAQLRARRLLLTHMSEAMLARLDELELDAAEDGMLIEL